ncbi:MAG TPA: peptidase E, partial [Fimbriimonas sp.]|nr:peptidase E [Fimbriimonas sp.]
MDTIAMNHRQVIAIGGGSFASTPANLKIDQYVIAASGVLSPNVLFLPTASADNSEYCQKFIDAYTDLGCNPSVLSLFWPHRLDFEELFLQQDVIYVGGGNTRNLLVLWREWGVDVALRKAYEAGVILTGVSAGANCWFETFSTDSMGPLAPWNGLGWLKGSFCPHFDSEVDRKPSLARMLASGDLGEGYAVCDHAALHFVDEELRCAVAGADSGRSFRVGDGWE